MEEKNLTAEEAAEAGNRREGFPGAEEKEKKEEGRERKFSSFSLLSCSFLWQLILRYS